MKTTTNLAIIATGAAVVAFVIYRAVPKVAAAVGDAAHAVNPLNPDNVFASGVNNVGAAIAGQAPGSWSLGSWLYDVTHPDELATPAPAPAANPLASWPIDFGTGDGWETASIDAYSRPPATSSGGASGSW